MVLTKDLIDDLKQTYPDSVQGIKSSEELIKRQAHLEVIGYIEMLLESQTMKKKKD